MERAVCRGTELLAIQEDQARKVVRRAVPVQLGGDVGIARGWGKGLAVRVDGMEHLRSDIGNRLARRSAEQGYRGVGVCIYAVSSELPEGVVKVSFRGYDGGGGHQGHQGHQGEGGEGGASGEDLTDIARHYGGGGHALACSANIPLATVNTWGDIAAPPPS